MLVHQVEQIVAADQLLDTVAVEQSGCREVEKLRPYTVPVAAALLAGTVTEEVQCSGVAEGQLASTVAGKSQGCTAVSAVAGRQLARTAAEEPQGCTAVYGLYCLAL